MKQTKYNVLYFTNNFCRFSLLASTPGGRNSIAFKDKSLQKSTYHSKEQLSGNERVLMQKTDEFVRLGLF